MGKDRLSEEELANAIWQDVPGAQVEIALFNDGATVAVRPKPQVTVMNRGQWEGYLIGVANVVRPAPSPNPS